MPSAAPARLFQAGLESTNGTAVAATAKLGVNDIQFRRTDNVNRPRLAKGTAIRSPGNEFPTIRGTEIIVPAHPYNQEQFAFWLEQSVKGGVAVAGAGPFTRTYTRSIVAAPALKAATYERRDTDFTNHVDHEFAYGLVRSWHLFGAQDGDIQLEVNAIANRREASTLTAAQTMPAVVHFPFSRSRIYLDPAFASIGSTLLTNKVISWDLTWYSGAKLLRTASNNTDLDADIDVVDGREVGLEFTAKLLLDKTLFDAEVTASEAQTLRGMRIRLDGASSRFTNIDFLAKYVDGSLTEIGEVDGQSVYEIKMMEATDDTNLLSILISNPTTFTPLGM